MRMIEKKGLLSIWEVPGLGYYVYRGETFLRPFPSLEEAKEYMSQLEGEGK